MLIRAYKHMRLCTFCDNLGPGRECRTPVNISFAATVHNCTSITGQPCETAHHRTAPTQPAFFFAIPMYSSWPGLFCCSLSPPFTICRPCQGGPRPCCDHSHLASGRKFPVAYLVPTGPPSFPSFPLFHSPSCPPPTCSPSGDQKLDLVKGVKGLAMPSSDTRADMLEYCSTTPHNTHSRSGWATMRQDRTDISATHPAGMRVPYGHTATLVCL